MSRLVKGSITDPNDPRVKLMNFVRQTKLTPQMMAEALGVARGTVYSWRRDDPNKWTSNYNAEKYLGILKNIECNYEGIPIPRRGKHPVIPITTSQSPISADLIGIEKQTLDSYSVDSQGTITGTNFGNPVRKTIFLLTGERDRVNNRISVLKEDILQMQQELSELETKSSNLDTTVDTLRKLYGNQLG